MYNNKYISIIVVDANYRHVKVNFKIKISVLKRFRYQKRINQNYNKITRKKVQKSLPCTDTIDLL